MKHNMNRESIRIVGNIAYVPLTQGRFAIIDAEDVEKVNQCSWHYQSVGYAATRLDYKILLLHRLILDSPTDVEIDHINGNRLDCRKCNLRFCTSSQNKYNQRIRDDNTSGYKGVSWLKKSHKWRAYIFFNNRQLQLGNFNDIKDAAQAYRDAAIKYFGDFARFE